MDKAKRRLSVITALPSRCRTSATVSLEDVHVDILFLVLQYLNWPEDFHSLALVSKALNRHVTPELFKTIIITPDPRRTLSLLTKLEADDVAGASVHIIVFDSVVRSVRPRIPAPEDFDRARKKDLSDSLICSCDDRHGDPHRMRLRLYQVLPKLHYLHTVCIKRWSHVLQGPLSAAECYHYWQPPDNGRSSILQKLRIKAPYRGPPAVMHGDRQPCPLDIVSLLLLRCKTVQKLFVVGTFPAMRFSNQHYAFSHLTVLVIGERTACANVWNGVLRNCKALKVFGLLNVHFRFEKLMMGCRFPYLESIEWFGYAFSSTTNARKPARSFIEFIEKHSNTIRHVSLAPRTCQPRGFPFDGGSRFFDPDNELLPNIETLRLQNWTVFSSEHDQWPHAESSRSRAMAEDLCRFVARRPKLVDLTITDFPCDYALRLTNEILVGRSMKRLLVGESLHQNQIIHVPSDAPGSRSWSRRWRLPGGMIRREQAEWALTRKHQYLRDVWLSYELCFEGMALEQSGYRPWLLQSKCPRNWLDYLRR